MIKCGRTGATLLYGTKCIGCDCHLAGFADGGTIPRGTEAPRIFGFDLASGPDKTAHIRVSDRYEFSMEDIERASESITREAEAHLRREHARRARAMEEEILRAAFGRGTWTTDPPWHFNCRSAYTPPAVEIITDPADRRGMNARRIGPT